MAGSAAETETVMLLMTGVTGNFTVGDTVTGGTSSAHGIIIRVQSYPLPTSATTLAVYVVDASGSFTNTETITGHVSGSGTLSSNASTSLYAIWAHETGADKVIGDQVTAIQSYFETSDFGLPTGGVVEQQQGQDRWTRLTRVEPDFDQVGDLSLVVTGREFARADVKESDPYVFDATTQKIDMREQRREIRLRFESNCAGGDYEAGKILLHIAPGDVRS
jgi:hypothetical protein